MAWKKGGSVKDYYLYVVIFAVILSIIVLPLGKLAPLDEPRVYAYDGHYYDLGIPVGISFSAFILLMIFIISGIIFWGTGNIWYNVIIDSSALAFIFMN
ncbi:hypothetical protein HLB03_11360, partial [Acidianus sp. DSM 29099]|nr:hypothetical protein [Acidianus sp. RZ1]